MSEMAAVLARLESMDKGITNIGAKTDVIYQKQVEMEANLKRLDLRFENLDKDREKEAAEQKKKNEALEKKDKEIEESIYWSKVASGVAIIGTVGLTTLKIVSWVAAPTMAPIFNNIPNPM